MVHISNMLDPDYAIYACVCEAYREDRPALRQANVPL